MAYIAPPVARKAANNLAFQNRLDEYLLLKLTKPHEYNPHQSYFDDSEDEFYEDDQEFSSDEYYFLQLRRQGSERLQETSARLRAPYQLSDRHIEIEDEPETEYGRSLCSEPVIEPELTTEIQSDEESPSIDGPSEENIPQYEPPVSLGIRNASHQPQMCFLLELLILYVHYVYFITSLVIDLSSTSVLRWMFTKASLRLRDSFRGGTSPLVPC